MVLVQDGAPPHWGLIVRVFMDETFPNLWIGTDGPTTWPPRSPDITPLDYFLWGCFKRVYATLFADCDERKAMIQAVAGTMTEDMLQNTWREMKYRIDILRATTGAYVVVY